MRDVAKMFGVSENRVRVLARERSAGKRYGWGYLFTYDDVEKMRPGRSGIKRTPQKRKPNV